MSKTLDQLIHWLIAFFVFLMPIFFLPITVNFYAFNKNFFLFFSLPIFIILWAIKSTISQKITFRITALDWPVFFFGLIFVLSTIIASPNKVEALLTPGATGTVLALVIFYFFITKTINRREYLLYSLIAGAGLVALISLYQFIGLGEILVPSTGGNGWQFLTSKAWTPAGSTLALITYLIIGLSLALTLAYKTSENVSRFIFLLASALIISALFATGYLFFNQEITLTLLPFRISWAIALETLKQNPLWGVGPANFVSAFNRFRPPVFNHYHFWNQRFAWASNYPLYLLTTTGFLGLLAFFWLAWRVIKNLAATTKQPFYLGIITSLFLLFILPLNFLLLFLIFTLLALWAPSRATAVWKVSGPILLALALVFASLVFYLGGRAYAAEIYFKKSLDALKQNQGFQAYEKQVRAYRLNPYRIDYRIAYSQTNLILANALASQTDLTDQERTDITRLVQQAIREARIATMLNPTDAKNWENLAQIYRRLINFAQGADQWAMAAYQQAILTDPVNPRIRVNFGGLFYSLGNYEAAITHFQNAINLKPDYANAYYNLAAALKENEEIEKAVTAMEAVVNLVNITSADYQKAKNELEELKARLPSPTPAAVEAELETLTEPEPLPSPAAVITPITLPSPILTPTP